LNEWVSHPMVQSIIVPFIAALIASKLLSRLRLSGLAVIAGFCAVVYLYLELWGSGSDGRERALSFH